MRGKRARQLRRLTYEAVTEVYQKAGTVPRSEYVVTNRGQMIECTGYRKLYQQLKRSYKEARK